MAKGKYRQDVRVGIILLVYTIIQLIINFLI